MKSYTEDFNKYLSAVDMIAKADAHLKQPLSLEEQAERLLGPLGSIRPDSHLSPENQ